MWYGSIVVGGQSHKCKRSNTNNGGNGRKCMELRKQWWEEGQKNDWTFLFYHDIKQPIWPAV
jgi:hypothetical protein